MSIREDNIGFAKQNVEVFRDFITKPQKVDDKESLELLLLGAAQAFRHLEIPDIKEIFLKVYGAIE